MKKMIMVITLLCGCQANNESTDVSEYYGELHYVCEIVCYEEIPYITFKIYGLNMTFKVSDKTAKYLTEYFM